MFARSIFLLLLLAGSASLRAQVPAKLTREEVLAATLVPYQGESIRGVDPSTLTGKVMCGYQGWFNCEGDGAGRGWAHWVKGRGPLSPQNVKIDLWPDVTELSPEERFATGFHHADGSPAEVFSSFREATVLRHFQWMRDYGLDGVFVQRFANGLQGPESLRQNNTVLTHCRAGAHRFGRTYAVMYDLSGLPAGRMDQVMDDWHQLHTRLKLDEDTAYLHHRGRPLVAVWGVGFNDHRAYTLAECRRLIEFLKNDGCAVMLGVPTYWREQTRDTLPDPELHEILALADILSPWTVGRYGTPQEAARYAEKQVAPDLAWCTEHGLDYLPVLFPGFSWHNMYPAAKTNSSPRRQGEFFWSQFQADLQAGAKMLYVAMFDEVDEGTAIFKCTNDVPPETEAPFATFEGLPSDYYLRLTGQGARMLRGELPLETPRPAP